MNNPQAENFIERCTRLASPISHPEIDEEWLRTFQILTSQIHLYRHSEENETYLFNCWLHRIHTLSYLCKLEWKVDEFINTPHGYKHIYKPLAELWWIVKKCLGRLYSNNLHIKFGNLYVEGALEGVWRNDSKSDTIKRMKGENATLRDYRNPFNDKEFPLTYKFIEKLRLRAVRDTDIRREFYTPFLKARVNLIEQMKTTKIISIRDIDDELFYSRSGSGKSLIKLPSKIWSV